MRRASTSVSKNEANASGGIKASKGRSSRHSTGGCVVAKALHPQNSTYEHSNPSPGVVAPWPFTTFGAAPRLSQRSSRSMGRSRKNAPPESHDMLDIPLRRSLSPKENLKREYDRPWLVGAKGWLTKSCEASRHASQPSHSPNGKRLKPRHSVCIGVCNLADGPHHAVARANTSPDLSPSRTIAQDVFVRTASGEDGQRAADHTNMRAITSPDLSPTHNIGHDVFVRTASDDDGQPAADKTTVKAITSPDLSPSGTIGQDVLVRTASEEDGQRAADHTNVRAITSPDLCPSHNIGHDVLVWTASGEDEQPAADKTPVRATTSPDLSSSGTIGQDVFVRTASDEDGQRGADRTGVRAITSPDLSPTHNIGHDVFGRTASDDDDQPVADKTTVRAITSPDLSSSGTIGQDVLVRIASDDDEQPAADKATVRAIASPDLGFTQNSGHDVFVRTASDEDEQPAADKTLVRAITSPDLSSGHSVGQDVLVRTASDDDGQRATDQTISVGVNCLGSGDTSSNSTSCAASTMRRTLSEDAIHRFKACSATTFSSQAENSIVPASTTHERRPSVKKMPRSPSPKKTDMIGKILAEQKEELSQKEMQSVLVTSVSVDLIENSVSIAVPSLHEPGADTASSPGAGVAEVVGSTESPPAFGTPPTWEALPQLTPDPQHVHCLDSTAQFRSEPPALDAIPTTPLASKMYARVAEEPTQKQCATELAEMPSTARGATSYECHAECMQTAPSTSYTNDCDVFSFAGSDVSERVRTASSHSIAEPEVETHCESSPLVDLADGLLRQPWQEDREQPSSHSIAEPEVETHCENSPLVDLADGLLRQPWQEDREQPSTQIFTEAEAEAQYAHSPLDDSAHGLLRQPLQEDVEQPSTQIFAEVEAEAHYENSPLDNSADDLPKQPAQEKPERSSDIDMGAEPEIHSGQGTPRRAFARLPGETPREAVERRKREAADREIARVRKATARRIASQHVVPRPFSAEVPPAEHIASVEAADTQAPVHAERQLRPEGGSPRNYGGCWSPTSPNSETDIMNALDLHRAADHMLDSQRSLLQSHVGVQSAGRGCYTGSSSGASEAAYPSFPVSWNSEHFGETPRAAARRRKCAAADRDLMQLKMQQAQVAGSAHQIAAQVREAQERAFWTPFATTGRAAPQRDLVSGTACQFVQNGAEELPGHSVFTPLG